MTLCKQLVSILFILIASLLFFGCATEDSDVKTGQSALEATNECIISCQERGLDEVTCAEVCSSIGGAGCVERCMDRGGDEERCTEGCASGGGDNCYDACIERGGDPDTCRLACVRSEAPNAVICTEGDETIRDGVTYLCKDGEWVVIDG